MSDTFTVPRLLFTAPASGVGKTLITCGILNLLQKKGLKVAAFKSGPDYIDPLFHTQVLHTKSRNLDTFFFDDDTTKYLLAKNATGYDIAIIEGGMGYYDGMAPDNTLASAYHLSKLTKSPSIIIVDAKASSLSVAAVVKGFLTLRSDNMIRGVILNRISSIRYQAVKEQIERACGVAVIGYVPPLKDIELKSRHLGLMLPQEYSDLQDNLDRLAEILKDTLDVDRMLDIAQQADTVSYTFEKVEPPKQKLRIAVARDDASCFIYEDNMDLLRSLGAEIVPFSILEDKSLPEGISGIMIFGGYPELHVRELSGNEAMRKAIYDAAAKHIPIYAECGGFMYLQEVLEDMKGSPFQMAGVIKGHARYTGKLTRFGYVNLTGGRMFGQDVGIIPAHEFHYYDSDQNGEDFLAEKPDKKRAWRCAFSSPDLYAGFPHIHFYGNVKVAKAFYDRCSKGAVTSCGI